MVLHQEVNVVETVHQTMFLITIDVKVLAAACGLIGNGLIRQIDGHRRLRIFPDALEQLCEEVLTHLYGQHEIVQLVVLVDVGEEAADGTFTT